MKQIYNFEQVSPPVLTERQLRAELERRKLQRRVALLAVAGGLMVIALLMWAVRFYPVYPQLTWFCGIYILIGVLGSASIALAYSKKGGALWHVRQR